MWELPEIVVLMPIIWKVWIKNMMAIFRTALNRESSALLLAKTITHPAARSLCDS